MSFAARIAKEKDKVYCLQYDKGTRESCYFFVKINPMRETAFLKALDGGLSAQYQLADFGEVVASGWGEPPARVKEVMAEQYALTFTD